MKREELDDIERSLREVQVKLNIVSTSGVLTHEDRERHFFALGGARHYLAEAVHVLERLRARAGVGS